MNDQISASDRLLVYIDDAAFPCTPEELLAHAEAGYAPDSMLRVLEHLSRRPYKNKEELGEVFRAMSRFASEMERL